VSARDAAAVGAEPAVRAPVAIVTGAASGIGLAVAGALGRAGWSVVGIDRARPAGERPPGLWDELADVRDEDAVRAAVQRAATRHGRLDAVVCCAGVSGSPAGDGPLGDTTGAAFDAVVGVNLRGAFVTVSAAWDALTRGGGSVVLVGSVLGLTGGGGPFQSTAYAVSKGGLVALTRAVASQGRAAGVRANCVAPGLVETPFAQRALADERIGAYVRERQPLADGPIAPERVAAAISFLCSDAAGDVTGQVLAIDAGWGLDPE
jgi:NAD(P)-dependent dehydrogenase (short-subunit alcohol dehydrogenase family)